MYIALLVYMYLYLFNAHLNCYFFYYRYGPPGSAICVYGANKTGGMHDNGINTVFNEAYHNLRPGVISCTANNVPNDEPFTVSNINCVYAYTLIYTFLVFTNISSVHCPLCVWQYVCMVHAEHGLGLSVALLLNLFGISLRYIVCYTIS